MSGCPLIWKVELRAELAVMIIRDTLRFTAPLSPHHRHKMAKPATTLSIHERTRVEDYLNDKIQTSADLESLESLLSTLRAQHELQRKQVRSVPYASMLAIVHADAGV